MQTITIRIDKNADILNEMIQKNISDAITIENINKNEINFSSSDITMLHLK